jgi:hypothetical protein
LEYLTNVIDKKPEETPLDDRAIIWFDYPNKLNPEKDVIALFCAGHLSDYVAWSETGKGYNDKLHSTAVRTRNWRSEYVVTEGIQKGASIGRDANSKDTNGAVDWMFPGGADVHGVTISARNEPLELPTNLPSPSPTLATPSRPPPVVAVSAVSARPLRLGRGHNYQFSRSISRSIVY